MAFGSGHAVGIVIPGTTEKITSPLLSVIPISPGWVTTTGICPACSNSPAGTTAASKVSLMNVVARPVAPTPPARHTTREVWLKREPSTRMLNPALPATTAFGSSDVSTGGGSC